MNIRPGSLTIGGNLAVENAVGAPQTSKPKDELSEKLQAVVMCLIQLNQSLLDALRDGDHDRAGGLDSDIDEAHRQRERTMRELQSHVLSHGCGKTRSA